LESLDDNHTRTAARTNIRLFVFVTTVRAIAVSARGSWVWYAEELTGQCDVVGPVGIGEEAVVTDAVEPVSPAQGVEQQSGELAPADAPTRAANEAI
jgi:hypothetical protein